MSHGSPVEVLDRRRRTHRTSGELDIYYVVL